MESQVSPSPASDLATIVLERVSITDYLFQLLVLITCLSLDNSFLMQSPARPRAGSIYDDKVNVTRILLTGGPCGGKTSALAAIKSDLTQLGYKVLEVPEAATIIAKGGAMIAAESFTAQEGLSFQKALIKMQIALEESFLEIG